MNLINLFQRSLAYLRRYPPASPRPYLDLDKPLDLPRPHSPDAPLSGEVLTPLLLPTPHGRAGSTVVMELLGSSPQIAFERAHPYEERYLTYLVHWAQMLGRSQPPEESWHAGVLMEEKIGDVKPFPMQGVSLPRACHEWGSLWERCLAAAWKEFSRFAALNQRLQKGTTLPVVYYAEKVPEWCFKVVRRILPGKTIYLLRDPRDIWLSWLAFNKKRGLNQFGPRNGQTQQVHLEKLALQWKGRLQTILRVLQAGNSGSEYVIRYEDLITDAAGEADRLSRWLGVQLTPIMSQASAETRGHMTSRDLASSLGRWKRELSADLNDLFLEHLEKELREVGYDLR
jgi:hypothetical protein